MESVVYDVTIEMFLFSSIINFVIKKVLFQTKSLIM